MREYTSTVTIIFGGNNLDAENEEDYKSGIQNLIGRFLFDIHAKKD